MAEVVGLRELKKQRTHDTIVRVAIELFDERGYHATTVADIAAAAEFAPSTVFAYFPTKEDIVFATWAPFEASFRERLEGRPAGEPAIEAFRDWAIRTIPPVLATPTEEMMILRKIIDSDERLLVQERARMAMFEEVLANEVAHDLGVSPDAAIIRIVAGAMAGAFGSILADRQSMAAGESERQISLVIAFVEAGLSAILHHDDSP